MSAAAKTLTLWLQMSTDDPALLTLPIAAEGEAASFETVARHASRGNVHHRTILDELVRLNMAIERAGRVELNAAGFVPATDLKGMLAFLGDNARDHLLAGVANTLGASAPLLERSVFATGISVEDCERIHQLARQRWSALHHELTREMTRAFEAADSTASGRIRVGIYTYYEDGRGSGKSFHGDSLETIGQKSMKYAFLRAGLLALSTALLLSCGGGGGGGGGGAAVGGAGIVGSGTGLSSGDGSSPAGGGGDGQGGGTSGSAATASAPGGTGTGSGGTGTSTASAAATAA